MAKATVSKHYKDNIYHIVKSIRTTSDMDFYWSKYVRDNDLTCEVTAKEALYFFASVIEDREFKRKYRKQRNDSAIKLCNFLSGVEEDLVFEIW